MRQTDAELAFQSKDILQFLRGRLPSWQELKALQDEKGYDLALTVLYRAVLQSQPHSAFIRHVQGTKPGFHDLKQGKSPVEVLIVPSVMPDSNQKWGAHCDWIRSLAREMGFSTDVVETSRKESIAGNARLIGNHLKNCESNNILLVTTGRGTTEMRFLLQKRKNADELRKVRGWLNINGCANGSRAIEQTVSSKLTQIQKQIIAWVRREKFAARLELRPDSPLFSEQLRAHERMMIVSVFGLLYSDQIPLGGAERFSRLKSEGLTDGFLLAKEAILRPGLLIPVPGLRHELDEANLQALLQRVLTVMGAAIQKTDQGLGFKSEPTLGSDLQR